MAATTAITTGALATPPETTASDSTAATITTPAATPPSPPPALAPHVCSTCRARKKACDKQLPTCGYCSRRSISCRYVASASDRKEESSCASPFRLDKTAPRHGVGTAASQASRVTSIHSSLRSSLVFVDSILEAIPSHLSDLQGLGGPSSIDHVLHAQVHRLARARGCYLDDITSRYFQGVHKWLPVISRNKFHADFVNSRSLWPADFSVLLLAMFLVVWQPPPDSGIDDDRETLHIVTKMLFAQVQAIIPPSTRLIQAGLLISIFEYAHELGDAAFVSISLCAKMASITWANVRTGGETRYETEEERNLWWGLVIYERVIACNRSAFGQPFLTEIPSIEDDLPSESEFLDRTPDTIYSEHQPLANWDKENVGSFGRSAQATFLLSRTIGSMKIDDLTTRNEVSSAIDVQLQKLLGIVLEQGGGIWGPYCGAVAIIINALFILHQCILDQASPNYTVGVSKQSSSVALDSMTRMVIDIAYSFNQNLPVIDTEVIPPMCVYLVRSVMHNFHQINIPGDEIRNRDFNELSKMLQYFNRRWKITDKPMSVQQPENLR